MRLRKSLVPGKSLRQSSAKLVATFALVGTIIGGLAAPAYSILVYDRNAAVAYANANYNKVVSDGYFYETSYPATQLVAGQPVPSGGDDCAHFVSSAIGTPGGGLTIPNRAGTYGEPGAARLDALLVGNSSVGGYGTKYQYGVLVNSISQLTPGDVIGYDWDKTADGSIGSMGAIDHTVIYTGNSKVDAHSTSHLGANWKLDDATYFFIHITLPDSIVPTTPSNVSPAAGASVANLTPSLTANAFSDGAIGSTHVAAEWIVNYGRGVAYDSGIDTTHLTSLTVPAGKLSVGNAYTWQVRYQDNYGDWSSYSAATALSIVAPPVVGDYDNNGIVDQADYLLWRNNQGTTNVLANDSIGGRIGAAQYDQWRSHFGQTGGVSSGAALGSSVAVPEPGTLSLMFLTAMSACIGQRRRTSPTFKAIST